jgi:hypothetical protein
LEWPANNLKIIEETNTGMTILLVMMVTIMDLFVFKEQDINLKKGALEEAT